MTDPDARTHILTFARHIGRAEQPPEAIARRRNWLCAEGNVTEDGLALVDALRDQSATRTVFRGNF